jgi:WD40 repeat protein
VRPHTHHVAIGYEDGTVAIVDPVPNRVVWRTDRAHGGAIRHLVFDRDGDRLISASADKSARVWTINANTPPLTLIGHAKPVDFGAFSPDGRVIVTGSSDSTFRLYDGHTGALHRVLELPQEYRDPIFDASLNAHAAFTSDGKTLVTVSSGDGEAISQPALVWDVASGALRHALPHPQGAIWHMAITDDDKYVVTASFDESAVLWDISTGKKRAGPLRHPAPLIKAVVYDGGRLIASASRDGTLRIWRADTGGLLHEVRVAVASETGPGQDAATLLDLAVSHNGRLLATAASSGRRTEISLWDAAEGTQSAVMRASGEPQSLTGLMFTDDDLTLLSMSRGGGLTVWSLPPAGQPLIDLARTIVGAAHGLLSEEQRVRFGLPRP